MGTQAEAGGSETRSGGQAFKGGVFQNHTHHHSPAVLQGDLGIFWDCVSLLRASKRACAIILRTDWECKPNIFFSSLSKSDDQLWL